MAQLVMVDTPGIHKPHHLLGERLVQSAKMTIGEVDVVLLLLCFVCETIVNEKVQGSGLKRRKRGS